MCETELARDWKVSQALVAEAIGGAAERGFVVTRGSRPPIVRVPRGKDVRELYEVRELSEIHALDQA